MDKIYRGMQNAAETIDKNFKEVDGILGDTSKYLFTGSAVFNDTITLTATTDDYHALLMTFSLLGNRGTLVIGNETTDVRWGSINLTNDNTSTFVGVGEIAVTRLNNKQYKVTFAKIVKDFKEVVAGAAADEISLISILGVR